MSRFIQSFLLPFTSVVYLVRYKRLALYAVIPILLNILAWIVTILIFSHYIWNWTQQYLSQFDAWYWLILIYFLAIVLLIVLIGISLLVSLMLISIIAAPFNDVLSEQTYILLSGQLQQEPFSFRKMWQDIHRTITTEVKKTTMIVGIFLGLLLINFIPGIGTMLWIGGSFLFAVWALAFEYLDYMLSRRNWSFQQRRQFIWEHKMHAFGLGMGIYLMLLIPFLNFILIPVSVIAATRCYYQIESDNPHIKAAGTVHTTDGKTG